MKSYLYTVPKAGTYLIAEYIERLGLTNTGYHVAMDKRLLTKDFDAETNAVWPSRTSERRLFAKTLREVPDNGFAFGHFPAPLLAANFGDYRFICAYRNPKKTLVSEFVDFRFRRKDVKWVSRESIESDSEAFITYLKGHGHNHIGIFATMIAVYSLVQEPLFTSHPAHRFCFLNFDDFLGDVSQAQRLAEFLGREDEDFRSAYQEAREAPTKTKAVDIKVDRSALWTDEAENIYQTLNTPALIDKARDLGWRL